MNTNGEIWMRYQVGHYNILSLQATHVGGLFGCTDQFQCELEIG
jgi:hypothetical protein